MAHVEVADAGADRLLAQDLEAFDLVLVGGFEQSDGVFEVDFAFVGVEVFEEAEDGFIGEISDCDNRLRISSLKFIQNFRKFLTSRYHNPMRIYTVSLPLVFHINNHIRKSLIIHIQLQILLQVIFLVIFLLSS